MPAATYPPNSSAVRVLRVRYLLLIDIALILCAVASAVFLRFDSPESTYAYLTHSWPFLVIAPLVRIPLYFRFNLYNRLWRYASIDEFRSIIAAGIVAPPLIALLNFGLLPLLALPYNTSRSIWLLEALCSLSLVAATRLVLRAGQHRGFLSLHPHAAQPGATPVLIAGAGDAGATVLREIQQNRESNMTVVGFVDDDPAKQHVSLLGVPVLGDRRAIPTLVAQHHIRQVIIAMPTVPGRVIREIVQLCEQAGIRPRIVPSIYSLVNGAITLNQLRNVEIEDLLRREPIVTDLAAVRRLLSGRRVLVTGGGGSIGRELCRQILACHPAELIILGHGENSVFEIEHELRARPELSDVRLTTCIADTRMAARIHTIFRTYRPEVVFHAAAHKHVPLMEANPGEAITNNVLGTRNILEASLAYDVSHFVMVSTDKAVNPTSIMGTSKRVAELLVLDAARRSGKCFATVRFGNVLGSRGSVLHTFKRQIAAGGPVTVTHPEITRFFMTIPEAVQLLLQAAALGHGGEVFMLDMGEPVRITQLAEDLIRLSGLEVGRDIEIEYTHLRPGEKLYEELFLAEEKYQCTAHPKLRIAANAGRYMPVGLTPKVNALVTAAQGDQRETLIRLLIELVPEFGTYGEAAKSLAADTVVACPSILPTHTGSLALAPEPNGASDD